MPIFDYSREAPGGLVFFSGIVDDKEDPNFYTQLENVFLCLEERLAGNGLSLKDLMMVTVWLSDIRCQFSEFNEFWIRYFEPNLGPPRSTCGVILSRSGLMVEVSAVAARASEAP